MSQQLGSKVERQGKAKSQLHPGTELYDKYTNGTVQSSKVSLVQGLNSSQGKKNVYTDDVSCTIYTDD